MVSMLSEFERPDSIMSRARVIVVEYLAGKRPSDPRHHEFARGIVATMDQVARANGYDRLQDVDETSVSHALNLQIALEVTNIRVSDPPVARYLQQRVAEHLTYEEDEEEDDFEDEDDATDEEHEPAAYAIGTVVRPLRGRGAKSSSQPQSEAQVGLSELLARIGGSSRHDAATGDTVLAWRGTDMVRVNSKRVPPATWVNAAFGQFLTRVMEYNGLVKGLQENRGMGSAGLRQMLRENLSVDVLVADARRAGVDVEQSGGFATKKTYFGHPLMGHFLEVTVPRGQNHVIDVAFASPDTFKPLSFLVAFVHKTNGEP